MSKYSNHQATAANIVSKTHRLSTEDVLYLCGVVKQDHPNYVTQHEKSVDDLASMWVEEIDQMSRCELEATLGASFYDQ